MSRTLYSLLLLILSQVIEGTLIKCPGRYEQDPALTRFRRYIHIDTSKEDNLNRAVEFWRQQAKELGLPFCVYTPAGLPVCVITLVGSDPSLPSIMLNSHMDVVPALEEEWMYPPFSAYLDDKGDIYGRGTQDSKDTTCQCMEAIRRFKKENVTLLRTLHVTLMPDEETGGLRGIKPFVKTKAFEDLNIGFIIDEGITSPNDTLVATYLDKRPWHLQVTTHSDDGIGSNAMEKARKFINLVSEYRESQQAIQKKVGPRDFGAYTTVHINIVDIGYKINIVPTKGKISVFMRLAQKSNVTEMEQLVNWWIAKTGQGTELKYTRRDDVFEATILDNSNHYWVAMKNAINEMNLDVVPAVYPVTSDSQVLRNLGYPSVGFSAKLRTMNRVHAKNEYQNADTYLKGIDIFYRILKSVGNVPPCEWGPYY